MMNKVVVEVSAMILGSKLEVVVTAPVLAWLYGYDPGLCACVITLVAEA